MPSDNEEKFINTTLSSSDDSSERIFLLHRNRRITLDALKFCETHKDVLESQMVLHDCNYDDSHNDLIALSKLVS